MKLWQKALFVLAMLLSVLVIVAYSANTVTVSGTYDFSVNNGCSTTVTTGCLKQFNVYDTTSGTGVLVGSIAAPSGATSATAAVSGSFSASIHAGARTFVITAQMADGTESDPKLSPVISQVVKPGAPVSLTLAAQ